MKNVLNHNPLFKGQNITFCFSKQNNVIFCNVKIVHRYDCTSPLIAIILVSTAKY